jgi:hypothetical protein
MSSRSALSTTSKKTAAGPVKAPKAKAPAAPKVASRAQSNTSVGSEQAKSRRHMSSVVDVIISPPRCLSYLRDFLYEKDLLEKIETCRKLLKDKENVNKVNEIKKQIKALEAAKPVNSKKIAELNATIEKTPALKAIVETQAQVAALNQDKIRIGSEVQVVLSAICDYFFFDIVNCAADKVPLNEKKNKNISLEHIVEASTNSKCYTLIRNLPVYQQALATVQEKKRAEAEKEAAKKTKKSKKTKEETPVDTPADTPVDTPTEDSSAEESDSESSTGNSSFVTYIEKGLGLIRKANPDNANLRVAGEVKKYLSDLVIAFIKRVAVASNTVVNDLSSVRTLSDKHVINIVKFWYQDEQHCVSEFDNIKSHINTKLDFFKDYIKVEKEKETA